MARNNKSVSRSSARAEVADAEKRHVEFLGEIRRVTVTENTANEKYSYLMAVPMIYSVWEGYFRLACSICFKRIHLTGKAKDQEDAYATLLLQREPFVESFLRNLLNSMVPGKAAIPKAGKGRYGAMRDFLPELKGWLEGTTPSSIDFDELVMTFSNVNRDVVELHADIIGLNLKNLEYGRLNELISRRNDIAHGGFVQFPTEADVISLLDYAELLIRKFNSSVHRWVIKN
jgi:RiboL-PSP-HEPN